MIIYIFGPDTYRATQKINEFKNRFIKEVDASGNNVIHIDGETIKIDELHSILSTGSFLARKKLIIIKNVSLNKHAEIHENLLELVKNDTSDIVIFWENQEAKKSKGKKTKTNFDAKLLLKLAKIKYRFKFDNLSEAETEKWLTNEFKKQKVEISHEIVSLILSLVGCDLWQLSNEIVKISNFGQKSKVTPKDIGLLIKARYDDDIWKLSDSIAQKNRILALKLISDQINSGNTELGILNLIIRQFKILAEIKAFLDNHQNIQSDYLAQELKIHPYVAKKSLSLAKNFTNLQIFNIYRSLLIADLKIKSSLIKPKIILEQLIATLC